MTNKNIFNQNQQKSDLINPDLEPNQGINFLTAMEKSIREQLEATKNPFDELIEKVQQDYENSGMKSQIDSMLEMMELSKKMTTESTQNCIQYVLNKQESDF